MTRYIWPVILASETEGEDAEIILYEAYAEAPNDTLVIQSEGFTLITTAARDGVDTITGTRTVELYPLIALKGRFEDLPIGTGFRRITERPRA